MFRRHRQGWVQQDPVAGSSRNQHGTQHKNCGWGDQGPGHQGSLGTLRTGLQWRGWAEAPGARQQEAGHLVRGWGGTGWDLAGSQAGSGTSQGQGLLSQECLYTSNTLGGFFFHRSAQLFANLCKLPAPTACSEEQIQTITRSSTASAHGRWTSTARFTRCSPPPDPGETLSNHFHLPPPFPRSEANLQLPAPAPCSSLPGWRGLVWPGRWSPLKAAPYTWSPFAGASPASWHTLKHRHQMQMHHRDLHCSKGYFLVRSHVTSW